MADPALEQYHFIGKDIVTFHTLFWPAMLHFSGRKTPDNVFVHGFLTVNNGEKMSKSRGTGLDPLKYLSLGMNPEWLRYYLAAKLSARNEDIDFNADDFMARVNSDLIGKYVNIASRAAGFIAKRFERQARRSVGRRRCAAAPSARRSRRHGRACMTSPRIRQGPARNHAAGRQGERLCGRQQTLGPGQRSPTRKRACTTCARCCIKAFRVLTCYLKPVLPALATQVEAFLQDRAAELLPTSASRWAPAMRSAPTST